MKAAAILSKTQHDGEHKGFSWDAVTAISSMLLTVTALVALAFSWRQIHDFREAERVHQLVEQRRWFGSQFSEVRKTLARIRLNDDGKLVPLKPDAAPGEMYQILNYFEEIGLLEKKGYLDAEDVWEEFGYWAFNFYEDAKPVIEHDRRDDPAVYTNFERLVAVLQQVEVRKTGRFRPLPRAELEDFYYYQRSLSSVATAEKSGKVVGRE